MTRTSMFLIFAAMTTAACPSQTDNVPDKPGDPAQGETTSPTVPEPPKPAVDEETPQK